mmetsp:Transcript_11242/g.15303  ORF Transcript_11242/g.15303 Transcript_11242/m.15303 type:complete len:184 (+) Transcript_11242:349-900(+)
MFAVVDIETSDQNRKLALALQVSEHPTFDVFMNMQRVHRTTSLSLLKTVALSYFPSSTTAAIAPAIDHHTTEDVEGKRSNNSDSKSLNPSIYDPPLEKTNAKGGSVSRKFEGKGKGYYHPKMPCLSCGCPWWLGDDWDATCIRCGWCAETDGYDDDSVPLPAFKDKWNQFRKYIVSGIAPPFP